MQVFLVSLAVVYALQVTIAIVSVLEETTKTWKDFWHSLNPLILLYPLVWAVKKFKQLK